MFSIHHTSKWGNFSCFPVVKMRELLMFSTHPPYISKWGNFWCFPLILYIYQNEGASHVSSHHISTQVYLPWKTASFALYIMDRNTEVWRVKVTLEVRSGGDLWPAPHHTSDDPWPAPHQISDGSTRCRGGLISRLHIMNSPQNMLLEHGVMWTRPHSVARRPANSKHQHNVGPMLGRRRRRPPLRKHKTFTKCWV